MGTLGVAVTALIVALIIVLAKQVVFRPRVMGVPQIRAYVDANSAATSIHTVETKIKPIVYLNSSGPGVYDAGTGRPIIVEDGKWNIELVGKKATISIEVTAKVESVVNPATESAGDTVRQGWV